MLFVRYLLASFLIVLLAVACSPEPEAFVPSASSFSFSIDPVTQTVTVDDFSAASLSPQQTSEEPRVLTGQELKVSSFNFSFLPGNVLRIESSFTNISEFNFEQPFSFSAAPSTSNIISSTEPTVSDADLGDDGVLSPGETTNILEFRVEHKGEPFSYSVNASAVVSEGETDPGGPDTSCDDPNQRVVFEDLALREAVEKELRDSIVTCSDILALRDLDVRNITSLGGLQKARNLEDLGLSASVIDVPIINSFIDLRRLTVSSLSDISSLSELTNPNLESLSIYRSSIGTFPSLETLTGLTYLRLDGNQMGDLTPIAQLSNLTGLRLDDNQIDDLTPIARLSNLTYLRLDNNQTDDLAPVVQLSNLITLNLNESLITDLTPLGSLPNLVDLQLGADLGVTEVSLLSGFPKLRGFSSYAPITELNLSNLPELRQISSPIPQLTEINLSNLPNLTRLLMTGNRNIKRVTLSNLPALTGLNFATNPINSLVVDDLPSLTSLGLSRSELVDLSNLNNLPSLTFLGARRGKLQDISALNKFPTLEEVSLLDNQISDISVLNNLQNLTVVNVEDNQISDLTLSDLPNLTRLEAGDNQISNVSLSNLPSLSRLGLFSNRITSVSISGSPSLENLKLANNQLTDISFLTEFQSFDVLTLSNNQIADLTPLSAFTYVFFLELTDNLISDVTPIENLTAANFDISLNCLDLSEGSDDLAILRRIGGNYRPQKTTCTP